MFSTGVYFLIDPSSGDGLSTPPFKDATFHEQLGVNNDKIVQGKVYKSTIVVKTFRNRFFLCRNAQRTSSPKFKSMNDWMSDKIIETLKPSAWAILPVSDGQNSRIEVHLAQEESEKVLIIKEKGSKYSQYESAKEESPLEKVLRIVVSPNCSKIAYLVLRGER